MNKVEQLKNRLSSWEGKKVSVNRLPMKKKIDRVHGAYEYYKKESLTPIRLWFNRKPIRWACRRDTEYSLYNNPAEIRLTVSCGLLSTTVRLNLNTYKSEEELKSDVCLHINKLQTTFNKYSQSLLSLEEAEELCENKRLKIVERTTKNLYEVTDSEWDVNKIACVTLGCLLIGVGLLINAFG